MILLVEDDDDIREALTDLLRGAGFEVAAAANGREALAHLARRSPFELIVLDLMMPVMDGFAFRRAQLEDVEAREIPVLVMTGVSDARDAQRRLDAAGAITKPFTPEVLLEAIERARRPVAH